MCIPGHQKGIGYSLLQWATHSIMVVLVPFWIFRKFSKPIRAIISNLSPSRATVQTFSQLHQEYFRAVFCDQCFMWYMLTALLTAFLTSFSLQPACYLLLTPSVTKLFLLLLTTLSSTTDDTQCYHTLSSTTDNTFLQNDINSFLSWSHTSNLTFHLSKTLMLHFPNQSTKIIDAT